MSLTLTADQKRALDRGEAICIAIEGRPCVIVAQDEYETVRAAATAAPLSPEQRRAIYFSRLESVQAGMIPKWLSTMIWTRARYEPDR